MSCDDEAAEAGRLLRAIARRDESEVMRLIEEEGDSVNESHKGLSALMVAVMTNDDSKQYITYFGLERSNSEPISLPLLELMLTKGADVTARDRRGWTALFYSIRGSSLETVRVLVEYGADVTIRDQQGQSLLHHLSNLRNEEAEEEMLRYLLSVGADPRVADCRSLSCVERLLQCQSSPWVVQVLVEHGVDLRNDCFVADNGSTLLHSLFYSSVPPWQKTSKVEALLNQGFDINVVNKLGQTPLHVAAARHLVPTTVIRCLCGLGADVTLADNLGDTALHIFLQNTAEIVSNRYFTKITVDELVSKGTDVNSKNLFGLTALHIAALSDDAKAVDILLQHGADRTALDRNGATPGHYAASAGSLKSLGALLRNGSADVKDDFEATVLDYASINDRKEVIEFLKTTYYDSQAREQIYVDPVPDEIDEYNGIGMVLDCDKVIAGDFEPLNRPKDLEAFSRRVLLRSVCEAPERNRVQEAVWALIAKLSDHCSHAHPYLSFKPKLRGSMSEGTKCGPPDEFDVMLVMENLGKHFDPVLMGKRHARLKCKGELITQEMPHLLDANNQFDAEILGHVLRDVIGTALWNSDLWSCRNLSLITFYKKNVCLYMELRWTCETFKMLKISLDLVPCIPLAVDASEMLCLEAWPLSLDLSHVSIHLLLPTSPLDDLGGSLGYELSFTEVESEMMKSLPETARKGYTLAKALRSPDTTPSFRYTDKGAVYLLNSKQSFLVSAGRKLMDKAAVLSGDNVLTSFMLKNALFWQVSRTPLSRRSDVTTGLSPYQWAKLIYLHIQDSLSDRNLPVFLTGSNLLRITREPSAVHSQIKHGCSLKTSRLYKLDRKPSVPPEEVADGFDYDPEDYRGEMQKRLTAVKIIKYILDVD